MNSRYIPIFLLLFCFLISGATGTARARETAENRGPVILSPDLSRIQEVRTEEQSFSFIFQDDDQVAAVMINGKAQKIQQAETVMITRRFKFSQGKSLLRISAKDSKGNSTERVFLIGYGRKQREYIPEEGPKEGPEKESNAFTWKVDLKGGMEIDSNPSNDMSSAIEIYKGVVDDDEQTDTRFTLDGIFSAEFGKYNAVGGISAVQYSRTKNKYLKTTMMFGGFGYKSYLSDGRSWMLDAMFTDINAGDYDYAMIQSVSPGMEFRSRGKRGEYRSLVLAMDLMVKMFAIESREDAFLGTLKYDFKSLDETRHNLFQNRVAIGTSTEGTESSEYTFISLDFDWKNKWDSGVRMDFGFGIKHRTFANDTARSADAKIIELGNQHVDIPFRLDAGVGWKFTDTLKVMFTAKYVFNLSNDVPYQRLLSGANLSAVF